MPRDPRYDILFEPVKIGPVVAKNRFFQVPHCNGMGHARPRAHAAMRGIKAEGGWAVVSTEEVEIHASSDISPHIEGRLWDDRDIGALQLVSDAVHAHGALAAIELAHNGMHAANLYSREVPIAPSPICLIGSYTPAQARGMTKADIRAYRRWHRDAALRSRRAGFDIVYVYAGHDLSLAMHFLQARHNRRSDEYGGSLVNRARLLRELIEETKDAIGGDCAVAVRFAVDELRGKDGIESRGEGREVIAMLAELPDLWDVNISDWQNDSATSRFAAEGYQEEFVRFVKGVTSKPVVGVGRFTSPDAMVSQIRRGVLDSDRCGAALDRRSIPAEQDCERRHRRHPRVHRLQHLRDRRSDFDADSLHPKSDDGRRMAQGLASGKHSAAQRRRLVLDRRRRSDRPRMCTTARPARVFGHAGRCRTGIGRTRDA
jgi:dimethylamine/trimethylamine dehydrogenase